MNKYLKEIYKNEVLLMLAHSQKIRVQDVASKLYLDKGRARRLLDSMVRAKRLKKQKIKYQGNADMNVYY